MRVETRQPKKGDRVRVTFEATYQEPVGEGAHASWHYVRADKVYTQDGWQVPPSATFEVLKPEPKEGDFGIWRNARGSDEYVRFDGLRWFDAQGIPLHSSHFVTVVDG